MFLNLSVKHKILLSLWMVTFLLLSLSGTVASVWFLQDQSRRIDDFLTREMDGVRDTLETYFSAYGSENPEMESVSTANFQAFLSRYLQDRVNRPMAYKTTVGVFDSQGDLIQASNLAIPITAGTVEAVGDFQLTTVSGRPEYRLATAPLKHVGRVLGTIRLACLTQTLGEVQTSFLASLVMVLVAVFLSFGFLGTVLVRWSLDPVRQMSLSAQDISESHLDLRLTVPSGNDELSQMALTLNKLLARLERDFEFEEALVGQLSHELRTPLAILRARNEVSLERLGDQPTPVKAVLEDNLADIDNLAALLNTLLALARLDGHIDPVRLVECDLIAVLRDLVEELVPLWEEKELTVKLSLPNGASKWAHSRPLPVTGDPVLLKQIFLNLLTNAYKYTPRGESLWLTIAGEGSKEAPFWSVVLRNPGPAIPEESLELVFKRFYRVEIQNPDGYERDSGLGQKGFGLGLSIAKTLVDLHHGSIRAFNPAGGGAAFEVRIPRRAEPPYRPSKRSLS